MKIKKLLSTIAALAIAASSFAGLGITASADETLTLTSTKSAQSDGSTITDSATLETLQAYNTQFRDWGSNDGTMKFGDGGTVALYQFDISSVEGTVTEATLTVNVTGTGDGKNVSNIRLLGYNGDMTSLSNNIGTIGGKVTDTGSFQPLDDTTSFSTGTSFPIELSANAMTYVVSALENDNTTVDFAVSANMVRAAKCATTATLSIKTVSSAVYTATFSETNGVVPTAVTIYSDEDMTTEIANGVLLDATTYYYKAVCAGYEDYTGSFTVAAANPAVSFTMTTKASAGAVTLNYVDGDGNNIGSKSVDMTGKYVDDSLTYYYPAYVVYENKLYKSSTDTYSGSIDALTAEAVSRDVSYTEQETEVFQYAEFDGANPAINYDSFSNGQGVTGNSSENKIACTVAESGVYKVTVHGGQFALDSTRNGSLMVNDVAVENATIPFSYYGGNVTVVEDVILNKDDILGVTIGRGASSLLDYVLIEKTGEIIPAISSVVTVAPEGMEITAPETVTDAADSETTVAYADLTDGKVVTTVYVKVDNATEGVAPVVTFNEFEDPAQATYFTTADANGYFVYQIIADTAVTVKSVTYTGAADYTAE